ncbi:MAG TPA: SurA N-terminal domain-containing protein [Geminicoccaceae bacterium]|nr:SurA N-terminal domain-containing protein [Geminicoccaceae bacterium]
MLHRFSLRSALWLALALAAGAVAAAPHTAGAQAVQGIAAVVNDDIVSTQELGERVRLARASTGLPDDPNTQRLLLQQALRTLIDEKLQAQEARRLNIAVTDQEVDAAIANIAQRNNLTTEQLGAFLAEHGTDIASLRAQLRSQIAWLKVVSREIRPKVVVTEGQIDLANRVAQPAAGERELLLSEIVLPVYTPEQEANVLADARQLVVALRGGSEFAPLARQMSVAASAETGGDLGWIPSSALAEDLRNALSRMSPGQFSDPIRTPLGVQVLWLREARQAAGQPAAAASTESRDQVRQRLAEEQVQRLAARYMRDLRRNAYLDVRI